MREAFVIDEECVFSDKMAAALRLENFHVTQLYTANDALIYLEANAVDASNAVIFLDIALEGGESEASGLFSFEKTDQFLKTGLVLAREIFERNIVGKDSAKSIVLYTAHYRTRLWNDIKEFCSSTGTRSWQKRADADIDDILEIALAYIRDD